MIKISLKSDIKAGFCWESKNGIYVRGYVFDTDKYLQAEEIIPMFSLVNNEEDLKHIISELNGIFAVIIVKKDKVLAAVDRYGVFKLFYAINGGGISIGDDTGGIVNALERKTLNRDAVKDWYHSGFAAKRDTLINGLFCINASEYLSYDGFTTSLRVEKYHIFSIFSDNEKSYEDYLGELSSIVKGVASRLVESLGGKRVLLPLSGGVDSRFCAMLLKMAGYEKVTCLSYGNRNGKEERIAKAAALKLGFEHIFIPYTYRDWFNLFKNEENLKYIDAVSSFKATPHFSDLFAARFLAGKYNSNDCVIIPGHVGSIAESMFDADTEYSHSDIVGKIIDKYFYFYGSKHKASMKYLHSRLDDYALRDNSVCTDEAQGAFDAAAYDTYRSNHLFMTLRPYEFYGFEWRLPLMDLEMVEFFKSVPVIYKGKTKLLLYDFVAGNCCPQVPFYIEPKTYLQKVIRNINDRRYGCINPFIKTKDMPEWNSMPSFIKVIYRFYRNYLSFASLKTLKYLIKNIDDN